MANSPPPQQQQQHPALLLLPGTDFDRPDHASRDVPFPVWVIGAALAVALLLGVIFGWRLRAQQRRRREVVPAVELAAIW